MPEETASLGSRSDECTPLQPADDCARAKAGAPAAHLGGKSIGLLGSFALTVNNISGAGMLEFPAIFQRAGYGPCLLCLLLVCPLSSVCATLLCDAMARLPGNGAFVRRAEFSDIFGHFLGRRWFLATQLAFFLCLLSQNVAAIVYAAQVLDSLTATLVLDESYALHFHAAYGGWVGLIGWRQDACSARSRNDGSCVPFTYDAAAAGGPASGGFVLTLGYVLCALLFLPWGLKNLDENISMQLVSFVALVALTLEFLWTFCAQGRLVERSRDRVPAWGDDWSDALGVIIFNFAFCVTIPSWVNEKRPSVDINQTVWASTVSSTLLYAAVGWLGGRAFDEMPDNMLACLSASDRVDAATHVCALLFGVFIIGCGIPVFCVLLRYNLVVSGVCREGWGLFWGGIFPWLMAWLVYRGHGVLELLSWSGLVLNGFVDFLCPALVSLAAARVAAGQTAGGDVPETVVGALPRCLRPHHEAFTRFLAASIVLLVGAGLYVKIW